MKKYLASLFLIPAIAVCAGTWPNKADLLDILVKAAPPVLQSFRADSGEFGSKPWICNDQNTLYFLAVLWSTPSPKNPYYHDAKLLKVIAKGGEKLVNEQDAKGMWIFRKKDNSTWGPIHMPWTYTRWAQAYLLVKDALPPESQAMWAKGLQLGYSHIAPMIAKGHTHNINAYHAAGLYAAGIAFNNEEWKTCATRFMHRLIARQDPVGYWTEHHGPVVGYNMVYLQSLGIYYYYSRDAKALAALQKGSKFHAAVLWEDGSSVSVIDERNPYSSAPRMGNIGFAFSPEGRWYMQKMAALQPLHQDNASHFLQMGEVGETNSPLDKSGRFLSSDNMFSMNQKGPYQWAISAYACKPNGSRWIMERQNHVELFHKKFGLFAGGGNTRMQPYFSNFTFGDPDTLQPDLTREKPNLLPKLPLQWYADSGSLSGNTLYLNYGANRTSITVTQEGSAIIVDFKLENAPDKPAMAHLQLLLTDGIRSADGKLFPPTQKVVTGKELGGKLRLPVGLIAMIPDHAQVRDGLPGFNPYQKLGKGATPRQVISIPLTAENPTARIRFEENHQQPDSLQLWNGDMSKVRVSSAWAPPCKAECKDNTLTVSGKGGGERPSYMIARIRVPACNVNGKVLKMDFDAPLAERPDSLYIKGKTADGKAVFSCQGFIPNTVQKPGKIELPLPQCGKGYLLVKKQVDAAPNTPVQTLEFHYSIIKRNAERSFSLRNIRLEKPAK